MAGARRNMFQCNGTEQAGEARRTGEQTKAAERAHIGGRGGVMWHIATGFWVALRLFERRSVVHRNGKYSLVPRES